MVTITLSKSGEVTADSNKQKHSAVTKTATYSNSYKI